MIDYLATIESSTGALLDTASALEPTTAVPTCGEWTITDLVTHLAVVQIRAVARVGKTEDQLPKIDLPNDSGGLIVAAREILADLVSTFSSASDDSLCWNWTAKDQNVAWMKRRQAHEVMIHLFDALVSAGRPDTSNWASLAGSDQRTQADGIDEFFEVFTGRLQGKGESLPQTSLHLHSVDGDNQGEWLLEPQSTGTITVHRGHAKADTAIRATTAELLLWIWGRGEPYSTQHLEIIGEAAGAASWRSYFSGI